VPAAERLRVSGMQTHKTNDGISSATALKPDVKDVARHRAAIAALAEESGAEPSYVTALYEHIYSELERNARVRAFLSILTCRTVRAALRQNAPTLSGVFARANRAL
jgi:Protein of unknown function (DUF3562)